MTKISLAILLLAASLAVSHGLYSVAYAQAAAEVAPLDAGAPALGTGLRVEIADPIENPGGFWSDAREAKAREGWPALAVVVLFAIARAARGRVAWLRTGKMAAYTAAGITALGALVDWQVGGGAWTTMAAAVLGAVALLLNPGPPPGAKSSSGTAPATSPANGAA